MKQSKPNSTIIPWGYLVLNGLLVLLFANNLSSLWRMHRSAVDALNSNILASNKAELLEKIRNTDPSWFMWSISSVALLLTLVLLIGWWLPIFEKYRPWFARISLIWFFGWLIYLIAINLRAAILISHFLAR